MHPRNRPDHAFTEPPARRWSLRPHPVREHHAVGVHERPHRAGSPNPHRPPRVEPYPTPAAPEGADEPAVPAPFPRSRTVLVRPAVNPGSRPPTDPVGRAPALAT